MARPARTRLVLATANPDKAAEIEVIVAPLGFDVSPRPADLPDVEETGSTLEDNARLKAAAIAAATGDAALADDTGLEVEALGGGPGVWSARYAGENATYAENVAKLLGALDGVPVERRRAWFRTVVMVCWPDGREVKAEGVTAGTIAGAPRGTAGFGYDPVFVPDEGGGRTYAELGPAKHAISHRARALQALAEQLRRLGDC